MFLLCCLPSLCSIVRGRSRMLLVHSVNRIYCSELLCGCVVLLLSCCFLSLVFVALCLCLGGPIQRALLWFVFENTYPTYAFGRVALSYTKPVLFPPACWLIVYPVEIRASGHDTPRLASWWCFVAFVHAPNYFVTHYRYFHVSVAGSLIVWT
jgi:hypothetical protein